MITLDAARREAMPERFDDAGKKLFSFICGFEDEDDDKEKELLGHGKKPIRHGSWRYDPKLLILRNDSKWLELDLEKISTAYELLDQMIPLALRGTNVDEMIELLEAVAHASGRTNLQGAYCPFGKAPKHPVRWG